MIALLVSLLSGCGDNASLHLPYDSALGRVIGQKALTVTGEHAGSGSSTQQAANEAWIAGYENYQPKATLAYDPQGSGAGVTSFLQGAVSWAGSDIPLTSSQRARSKAVCGGEQAVDFPIYISPIAFIYHLDGLKSASLHLSAPMLADIFSGKMTWWDDARISAMNPHLKARLPHLQITPVWRSDQSGTSQIVSSYLSTAAPRKWPSSTGKVWPYTAGQGAKGTAGVSSAISQAQGTIGYVDYAQIGSAGTVSLLQGSTAVPPSKKASAAFIRHALKRSATIRNTTSQTATNKISDMALDLDYSNTSQDVYPLTQVSYLVTCPTFANASTRAFMGSWLYYVASQQAQQLSATVAGTVEIPRSLGSAIQRAGLIMLGKEASDTSDTK